MRGATTKTASLVAGLLGVLGGLWITPASAQSIVCCNQPIDVQGSWIGTGRVADCQQYLDTAPPATARRMCEQRSWLGCLNLRRCEDLAAESKSTKDRGTPVTATPPGKTPVPSNLRRPLESPRASPSSSNLTQATPPPAGIVGGVTLSSLTLDPTSVAGGNGVTATVTLTAPAPAGGFKVNLSSSDTDRARPLPGSVTVPTGSTTLDVIVETFPPAEGPDVAPPDPTLRITASATTYPKMARVSKSATLTVTAAALVGFDVTTPIPSGTSATATLTLNGPAPTAGIDISVSSSSPSDMTMPSSVTISPGARTAGFTITPDPEIYDRSFTLEARRSTFDTERAGLFVRVPEPVLLRCGVGHTVDHVREYTGGDDVTCNVRLDGRAPFDYGVDLHSSDESHARVGKSVTIPEGRWDADFTVSTLTVTAPLVVTISGTQRGKTVSGTFRLITFGLDRIVVQPNPVNGGRTVEATVYLTGPATSAADVTIESNDLNVFHVLEPVHIATGQAQGSREVATAEVEQDRVVRVTARYGLGSVQTELTVKRTPRPDLRVKIEHPNVRQLSVLVYNAGDGDAAASTLKLEFFKYGNLVDSQTFAIGSLAPGSSDGPPLLHTDSQITKWKAYADDLDVVTESDEENNTAELGY